MAEGHVQRLLLHHHNGLLSQQLVIGVLSLGDDAVVRSEPLFFQLGGGLPSFGGFSPVCVLAGRCSRRQMHCFDLLVYFAA
jgi:hypothetical protein